MRLHLTIALLFVAAPVSHVPSLPIPPPQMLFDDFSYTSKDQLKGNGWIIRTEPGWPGVPGATWSEEGVSFLKDPDQPNNWICV